MREPWKLAYSGALGKKNQDDAKSQDEEEEKPKERERQINRFNRAWKRLRPPQEESENESEISDQ